MRQQIRLINLSVIQPIASFAIPQMQAGVRQVLTMKYFFPLNQENMVVYLATCVIQIPEIASHLVALIAMNTPCYR